MSRYRNTVLLSCLILVVFTTSTAWASTPAYGMDSLPDVGPEDPHDRIARSLQNPGRSSAMLVLEDRGSITPVTVPLDGDEGEPLTLDPCDPGRLLGTEAVPSMTCTNRALTFPAIASGASVLDSRLVPSLALGIHRLGSIGPEVADSSPPERAGTRPDVIHGTEDLDTRPSERRDRGSSSPVPAPTSRGVWFVIGLATVSGVAAIFPILYRRVLDGEVLENTLRQRLLEIVCERPATYQTEIARELDIHPSTAAYHAEILEESGHIFSQRDGREIRYYPADCGAEEIDADLHAALQRDAKRKIVEVLLDDPASSISEVARRLDRHPSNVTRSANFLVERDILLDRDSDGQRKLVVNPEVDDQVRGLLGVDDGGAVRAGAVDDSASSPTR